jgi:transcriptional regulator with XRE-family HTH domain
LQGVDVSTELDEPFGSYLRRVRRRAGYADLRDVAKELGVNRNTVGAYERGERLPDIDYLADFADVMDADLAALIRLRLASGPSADRTVVSILNEMARQPPPLENVPEPESLTQGGSGGDNTLAVELIDRELLQSCIEALEERPEYQRLGPAEKSRAIVALYELCSVQDSQPDALLRRTA